MSPDNPHNRDLSARLADRYPFGELTAARGERLLDPFGNRWCAQARGYVFCEPIRAACAASSPSPPNDHWVNPASRSGS
jgi:hypothetical protein